ncbi:MAG: phage tail protein [Gemmatimonadales bacterium]|nr:MAG: phage tail protein [Gemmatimonadales bacterium]
MPHSSPTPGGSGSRAARSSFRILIGDEEVDVLSVSPLHMVDRRLVDGRSGVQGAWGVPTVTLRRAVDSSRVLHTWGHSAGSGKPDLRTVTVILLSGPGGEVVQRWELRKARPVRWSGPELDTLSGELAIEELEITYESVEWL